MIAATPTCSQQIQAFTSEKRLTQKDLMDAGQISRTATNHYFHGEHEPRFGTLQRWGIVFGLNMNWFFYGDGAMFRTTTPSSQHPSEESALRNQVAHLRIVHGAIKDDHALATRETKEVVIKGQDKEAMEAQIRLIDHVCESLAKNGASQEMIQRAILAIVSGAF